MKYIIMVLLMFSFGCAPGIDGKDGLPGRNGSPGQDGIDGKDGLPGRDGVDGKDGRDGEDGHTPVFTMVALELIASNRTSMVKPLDKILLVPMPSTLYVEGPTRDVGDRWISIESESKVYCYLARGRSMTYKLKSVQSLGRKCAKDSTESMAPFEVFEKYIGMSVEIPGYDEEAFITVNLNGFHFE